MGEKSVKVVVYATRDTGCLYHVELWSSRPILRVHEHGNWCGTERWITPVQGMKSSHFQRIFQHLPEPGVEVIEITSYYRKKDNE